MIKAENVSKQFIRNVRNDEQGKASFKRRTKEEFLAVNGVSLEAKEGEILGILGPNGAGKTTLLRMLSCIMEPTDGKIEIYDGDLNPITDMVEKKKHIGYLSGNTKLYNRFSTRELLCILADIYGISKEDTQKRIEFIENVLEMHSFIDNRIEKLSTGQTQRANIARCLIHTPDIYIFDEPTLGLDVISSDAIVNFMKKEKENNKCVLYSTHYMEEAQYLCDRIFMIYKGQKIAYGTPAELMEATSTDNLRDTFKVLIKKEGANDEI
ncbi:MAG: ATP-binding cassette domain-containing protein [Lachnospiraceae bacterium]|nr:ATP-binding cassette domain-containing protein [Lachnospiraceae bacterium]